MIFVTQISFYGHESYMNFNNSNLFTDIHFPNSANMRKLTENFTVLNQKEHQEIPLLVRRKILDKEKVAEIQAKRAGDWYFYKITQSNLPKPYLLTQRALNIPFERRFLDPSEYNKYIKPSVYQQLDFSKIISIHVVYERWTEKVVRVVYYDVKWVEYKTKCFKV